MSLSPDLHRLRLFLAVLDAGSVTLAARNLGFAPSTVSEQMRTLSRECGGELFRRRGTGIVATDIARLLEPHARTLMIQFARATTDLREHHQNTSSRISVDFVQSAGSSIISPAVAAYSRKHPAVKVELCLQRDPLASLESVREGETDLTFSFAADEDLGEGLVASPGLFDPFVAVLPVGDPLGEQPEVTLSDIRDRPWISHDNPLGSCSQGLVEQCRRVGFDPPYEFTTDTFDTALDLVGAGLGTAVVPALALARPRDDVRLRKIRSSGSVVGDVPGRRMVLVHRPDTRPTVMQLHDLMLRRGSEFLDDEEYLAEDGPR